MKRNSCTTLLFNAQVRGMRVDREDYLHLRDISSHKMVSNQFGLLSLSVCLNLDFPNSPDNSKS